MDELEGLTDLQIESLEKSRQRVIESIGKNMYLYGITLSVGHLYGTMFFENKPVTLDEMGKAMEMSKTSMSTGMRTLIDLKMVNKVWGKGSRKDLYEVESDWYQTFIDYFSIKWRQSIEMNMQMLNKSTADLDALLLDDPHNEKIQAIVTTDKSKINEALEYYNWLNRLIDAFETEEIFKWIPKK